MRGRGIVTAGQAFPSYVDAGYHVITQPTRIRTWGIPTGPGWFDRPGKWNVILPPVTLGLLDLIREWLARVRL